MLGRDIPNADSHPTVRNNSKQQILASTDKLFPNPSPELISIQSGVCYVFLMLRFSVETTQLSPFFRCNCGYTNKLLLYTLQALMGDVEQFCQVTAGESCPPRASKVDWKKVPRNSQANR